MPKQPANPDLNDSVKNKVTWREPFLAEMHAAVQYSELIAPHCPKVGTKGGRSPISQEIILRVYLLQNWHALRDPMADEALCDSEPKCSVAVLDLCADKGISLRSGTLLDAPLLHNNIAFTQVSEVASTKKGKDCYSGVKASASVDQATVSMRRRQRSPTVEA